MATNKRQNLMTREQFIKLIKKSRRERANMSPEEIKKEQQRIANIAAYNKKTWEERDIANIALAETNTNSR